MPRLPMLAVNTAVLNGTLEAALLRFPGAGVLGHGQRRDERGELAALGLGGDVHERGVSGV